MKRNSLFIVVMVLISHFAVAQKEYKYRRAVSEVSSAGWYSIPLSAETLISSQPDFSDIRLYNFSGKDTAESPYVIKIRYDIIKDEVVELPMINKSTKDGKLYVTFEVAKNQQVNYLDLNTDENNFNGYVQIEGSMDQHEWFAIDSLQRILSIQKDGIDFRSSTLHFEVNNYHFLRLKIDVDHPLRVVSAAFRKRKITKGIALPAPLNYKTSSNRKTKQTILEANFSSTAPVSFVRIGVDNTLDFYRPITIEALTDSTRTPKGWDYGYTSLYNGYIISGTAMEFEFGWVMAKKLKVTIYNADNSPLSITSFTATGPEIDIFARLGVGQNFLYYGNTAAGPPSYDVVHFEDKIPEQPPLLTLGEEINNLQPVVTPSPFLESKNWLWVAMGLVIFVLGYFTLKMMNSKK